MKYIPIETEPVNAAFWDSEDPRNVTEVINLLREFGLSMTLDTSVENYDIDLEVRRDEDLIQTVPDRCWLVIHTGGTVESMSPTAFFKSYRSQ